MHDVDHEGSEPAELLEEIAQLRMKVESKLIVMAAAAIGGFSAATSLSCLPTCSI